MVCQHFSQSFDTVALGCMSVRETEGNGEHMEASVCL